MNAASHGGDLLRMAAMAECDPAALLDFSVNVRPEGPPDFIRAALVRAMTALAVYPSPHAEEARRAAARHHGLDADRFAFGNGSNELIHALARTLKKRGAPAAYVVEPAFSEYALACRLTGLEVRRLWGGLTAKGPSEEEPVRSAGIPQETPERTKSRCEERPAEDSADPLLKALSAAPAGSAVFLANPGNPSGLFREADACLRLMASRPDLLWIIDEAFIEYVGPDASASVLPRLPANGIVLRSLTKFHAVPGVRLGYLAATPDMAAAVRAEIPAWSVNAFALGAALAVFADESDFAARTRAENAARRADLMAALSLPGIRVMPSAANYILFRFPGAPRDLLPILLKRFGIAVRDCSNYPGLEDGSWFRAAVRFPHDHRRLAEALREIMHTARPAGSNAVPQLAGFPAPHPSSPNTPPSSPDAAPPSSSRMDPPAHEREEHRPAPEGSPAARPPHALNVLGKREEGVRGRGEDNPSPEGFPLPSPGGANRPRRTPALMLQGTSSNAGKSVLAAAFCRIFRQDGYDVAPFKAQNMSLNSGVTAAGDEMGRAQIVQAQAARVDPDARMNPILLKPHSDTGSQVIVLGQPAGHMGVLDYFKKKRDLWPTVCRAYDEVAAGHEIMVLEGAGSPGEINLKGHDLVNMRMADHARASVLLVGDIDRGGVYASFLGTWMTFSDAERRLLTGYIVNRFRGDASLLASAHRYVLDCTGAPVLGTVPFIRDLNLPEEDMAGFDWGAPADCGPKEPGTLDIAVIMVRHVSNYTDFAPLALEPDVRLRPVRRVEDWGAPDVVMLPGSKSVVPDLEDLRRSGLADRILAHAEAGRWLFGVCGGLQMLGRDILDPRGVESAAPRVAGLGLMDLRSTFAADKTLVRVPRAETPLGVDSGGYEIHHGITEHGPSALPLFLRADRAYDDPAARICGYVTGRRWATYLHGVFDDDAFRRAWLDHVRADLGLTPQNRPLATYDLEKALDRLADTVRASINMQTIYRSMGL